jgi:uncharacterized protein
MQPQDNESQSKPYFFAVQALHHNPLMDLLWLAIRPQRVSADSPTACWIRQHPIASVVSLAYAITWIGLVPLIRDPGIALQADLRHASNPAVLVYVFAGVLGCLWAAIMVAGAVGGVSGRYQLLLAYLKGRVGFQWYLAALFSPTIIFAATIGLDFFVTGKLPRIPVLSLAPSALLSSYAILTARYMLGNFEEICWRGSVLPRLQAKNSALVSALIVGLFQGVWHLPYLFVEGHYVQSVGLVAIIVQSIAMGIVATWIYNNTRGSLLMVALFHAAYDALSQFQGNDLKLLYLSICVWCAAAIILLIIFGANRLSRNPYSEFIYATSLSPKK